MTRRAAAEFQQKIVALRAHLAGAGSNHDASSLSRSYGLPLKDVERIIRSMEHAR